MGNAFIAVIVIVAFLLLGLFLFKACTPTTYNKIPGHSISDGTFKATGWLTDLIQGLDDQPNYGGNITYG